MSDSKEVPNDADRASVHRVVHTPGPWRPGRADKSYDAGILDNAFAVFAEPRHQQDCGLQGNAAVICVIAKPERMTEEDIANAKLIAAAPDMLDVLRMVRQYGKSGETDENVYDFVDAVIRKATGEVV